MSYVHAPNGVVADYPYSYEKLRADYPNVSFPALPGDWLATYSVYPVVPVAVPQVPLNKNLTEGDPIFSNGAWRQNWVLEDATPEEIAERTEQAAQAQELDLAKLDPWIIAYLGMTPEQSFTYIENNSATLAALRTNVARLAYAVRVLIRREFNA